MLGVGSFFVPGIMRVPSSWYLDPAVGFLRLIGTYRRADSLFDGVRYVLLLAFTFLTHTI